MILEVQFIGYGGMKGKETMYLNGGCGSEFQNDIAEAQITSNGTWSLSVNLPLPCILEWKWRADDDWENIDDNKNRYTNLSRSTVIHSIFNSKYEKNTDIKG